MIEGLNETYYHIEMLRYDLYRLVEKNTNLIEDNILHKIPITTNSNAYWNGQSIKIIIPEIIPKKTLSSKQWDEKVSGYWIGCITNALRDLDLEIKYLKAICLIVTYSPFKMRWDVDNRCYKFIIDGIRYSRILHDDDWKNMTVILAGSIDTQRPRTEVFIKEGFSLNEYINNEFGSF